MHYLGRLISITASYALLIAVAERVFTFLARLYTSRLQRKTQGFHSFASPTVFPVAKIRSLSNFDYKATKPIKYRPFENKRHVVMGKGLENS